MKEKLSVTTLTKNCPLYIKLEELYPLSQDSIEAAFGTWVHDAIAMGIELLLNNQKISIENLLTTAAFQHYNPLVKQMNSDSVLKREAARLVSNGLKYVLSLNINHKEVFIEKKIEVIIHEIPIKIVGRFDFGYDNTIIDWKSGTFSADEHRMELHLYAYLAYTSNLMSTPIEIRNVYLGGEQVKVVSELLNENDIKNIHEHITKLIRASHNNPKPNPSGSCFLCEYKFRCPLYFRLTQENIIMTKVQRISQQLEKANQYRKLGMELKTLAQKIDTMANKLINKQKNIKRDLESKNIFPELIEEKVWSKKLIPLVNQLTEKEKEELLISLLKESSTVRKDSLPHKIKNLLYTFKNINLNKLHKI